MSNAALIRHVLFAVALVALLVTVATWALSPLAPARGISAMVAFILCALTLALDRHAKYRGA